MAAFELRHCIYEAFPYDIISLGLDGAYTARLDELNDRYEVEVWDHITGQESRVTHLARETISLEEEQPVLRGGEIVMAAPETFLTELFPDEQEELRELIETLRNTIEDQERDLVPIPLQIKGEEIEEKQRKVESYYELVDVLEEESPENPDIIKHLQSASAATKSAEPFKLMANNFSKRGCVDAEGLCYLYAAFIELTNENTSEAIAMAQKAQNIFNNTTLEEFIGNLFYKNENRKDALRIFKKIKDESADKYTAIICKIILCDPNDLSNYIDLAEISKGTKYTARRQLIYMYAYRCFYFHENLTGTTLFSDMAEKVDHDDLLPHVIQYHINKGIKWTPQELASAGEAIGHRYMSQECYEEALHFFECANSAKRNEAYYQAITICNKKLERMHDNIGIYYDWGRFHEDNAREATEDDPKELLKAVNNYAKSVSLSEKFEDNSFDARASIFRILIGVSNEGELPDHYSTYKDLLLTQASWLSNYHAKDPDRRLEILLDAYQATGDSAFGIKLAHMYKKLQRYEESGNTYFEVALREYALREHSGNIILCLNEIDELCKKGWYELNADQKQKRTEINNHSILQEAVVGLLQKQQALDERLKLVEEFMSGRLVSMVRKVDQI